MATSADSLELLVADLTYVEGEFHENVGVLINTSTGIIDDIIYNVNGIGIMEKYGNIGNFAIRYLKSRALIPGLINCHSHSFQRGLRGLGENYPPNVMDDFWSWRETMYNLAQNCTKQQFEDIVYQSFYEMRRVGITSVGEFHYFHHLNSNINGNTDYEFDDIILDIAKKVGLRIVLLSAYYNQSSVDGKSILPKQSRFYTPSLSNFFSQIKYLLDKTKDNNLQSIGIVAHSIRAVNIKDIAELHKFSINNNLIMHMHIDEQINEVIQCRKYYNNVEPTKLLLNNLDNNNLDNFTTIHNTLTNGKDIDDFIGNRGRICICPLTECNLGDGIFNLGDLDPKQKQKELINNLCVGTDCNERIDLFEELRMLEYSQRLKYRKRGIYSFKSGDSDISNVLFNIATIQGSKSLKLNNGEIKKKKFADLVCIDLSAMCLNGWTKDTLLSSIIFGGSGYEVVTDSCINGKWMHFRPTLTSKL